MSVIVVFLFLFVILVILCLLFSSKCKIGTGIWEDVELPKVIMYNQKSYRVAYGVYIVLHYALLIIGTLTLGISVYLNFEDTPEAKEIRIACSILSFVVFIIQIGFNFERLASIYGYAFRRMEYAILDYAHQTHQLVKEIDRKEQKAPSDSPAPDSAPYPESMVEEEAYPCSPDHYQAYKILLEANKETQQAIQDRFV